VPTVRPLRSKTHRQAATLGISINVEDNRSTGPQWHTGRDTGRRGRKARPIPSPREAPGKEQEETSEALSPQVPGEGGRARHEKRNARWAIEGRGGTARVVMKRERCKRNKATAAGRGRLPFSTVFGDRAVAAFAGSHPPSGLAGAPDDAAPNKPWA